MNELHNIVFKANDVLALHGFTTQFTLFTFVLTILVEVVFLGYFIYSAYKHNDIFDMAMGEDKPMIFISLAYMYALIYIIGGYGPFLFITLALGFVLIVVKNEKYTVLREYIEDIMF